MLHEKDGCAQAKPKAARAAPPKEYNKRGERR